MSGCVSCFTTEAASLTGPTEILNCCVTASNASAFHSALSALTCATKVDRVFLCVMVGKFFFPVMERELCNRGESSPAPLFLFF